MSRNDVTQDFSLEMFINIYTIKVISTMEKKEYGELRVKFLKIFANIPDKIRSEHSVVIIEDKPYTWNSAAIEVKNDTAIGKKIIETLKRSRLI